MFNSFFAASPVSAAPKCQQTPATQPTCQGCQISTPVDPTAAGLPSVAPLTADSPPQGLITRFTKGEGTMSTVILPPFQTSTTTAPLTIDIDTQERHQAIWGYGAAMTDASVINLDRLSADQQKQLMIKIFDPQQGAGYNYIRVPMSSNDFSVNEYTLDDTPGNQPDPTLAHYDFSRELGIVKYLRMAKQINPDMQFMLTPWTAPAWMKTPNHLDGGTLMPQYYEVYATYLIKTLEEFQKQGLPIDTMSILNEPLIPPAATTWYFSQMYMSQIEMGKFISGYLAPMMKSEQQAGRLGNVKLLLHDHNWDNGGYVNSMLENSAIAEVTAGVAFHCYMGTPQAMFKYMAPHPDEPLFNTECTAMLGAEKSGDFQWWMQNQSLDVIRGGMVGTIGWNLLLDTSGGPSNPAGCKGCRGMVTLNKDLSVTFNEEFNALAQVSRFAKRGAVRIGSTDLSEEGVANVAFQNPDGSIALVLRNGKPFPVTVSVRDEACKTTTVTVPASGAVSLVWPHN
jgi:glucosylceramidase